MEGPVMAELLVKLRSVFHSDPTKDASGAYKRGQVVVVMPDDHPWGREEVPPKFFLIKVPGVSVGQVQKYTQQQVEGGVITRRRLWVIRWKDLPEAARDKVLDTGMLIIKVGTYAGPFDYTWTQVKGFFRNQLTGIDETEDLT
jgi:hypothetical protein